MSRTSIRPYEEITILSLANITDETKFQFFCKIKEKEDAYIILTDDNSEYKFTLTEEKFVDVHMGDILLAFGQKKGEEMIAGLKAKYADVQKRQADGLLSPKEAQAEGAPSSPPESTPKRHP